jgi:hypothetical protein
VSVDVTSKMIDAGRLVIMEACDQMMKRDPFFAPDALGLFGNGCLIEEIYRAMTNAAVEVVDG